ncbi:hypothetical protein AC578_3300 [Pseudocercospora eumusae]|uniref:DUF7918 domain-containing protein n=1 Tax=Pseudocercospora eumusae TaxID=321146 RepID=A0A139HCG5_9PEZI|nr:hypothetical protein AC578_3300 [Pseudocercospora eumusae]
MPESNEDAESVIGGISRRLCGACMCFLHFCRNLLRYQHPHGTPSIMVISDSIPDVAVAVHVGDDALQEYIGNDEDESQNKNKVTRYVEVAPNMKFEIHADLHAIPSNFYREDEPLEEGEIHIGPQFGLAWFVIIDGELLDSVLLDDNMAKTYYSADNTCLSRGFRSGSKLRRFQFSAIEEGGSKKGNLGDERLKELGTIRITVHHVKILNLVGQEVHQKREIGPLDEAAVKGKEIETSVSLGHPAEDASTTAVWVKTIQIDPENPVATYEFRYRSKAELQKLNIIPKDQEPEQPPAAEEEDRDLESMSPEEQLAELKRLRAVERERGAQTIRIKEEIRETASRAERRRRKTPTTVIVLGDDGEIEAEYERPTSSAIPASPTMDLDSDESDAEVLP